MEKIIENMLFIFENFKNKHPMAKMWFEQFSGSI